MILAEKDFKYNHYPYYDEEKNTGTGKRPKNKRKLKNLLMIIFIGSVSIMLLFRYSIIYQQSITLDKMEEKIKYTENLNQQLKIKIASMSDPVRIEKIAKEKLGMQEPADNQIVYINVGKNDTTVKRSNVAHATNDKNNQNISIFIKILGIFNR